MAGNEGDAGSDALRDRSTPHADSASSEAASSVPFVSSGVSRAERLAAIRARIEAGVYDTPERLEAAVVMGEPLNDADAAALREFAGDAVAVHKV